MTCQTRATEGSEDFFPENANRKKSCLIRKVSTAAKVARILHFSPPDSAASAAVSLSCPGLTQSNQNVSRLIAPTRGFRFKQTGEQNKYSLAFS